MLRLWSKIHSDFSQPYFTRGITVAPVIGSRLGLLHLSAQPFAVVMHISCCTVVKWVRLSGATDSAVASPNRGALRGSGSFHSGRR